MAELRWPSFRREGRGLPAGRDRNRAGPRLGLAIALAIALTGLGAGPAAAVKVGVLTDLSGILADSNGKGSVIAAELAAEDLGGSLLGAPIEIVGADHQLKPDVGSAVVRKWFDVDGVDAVADLTISPIALAAQQIAKSKNKVVLISGAGTQALFGSGCTPTSFVWTFDTATQTATAARVADRPATKWFLISPSYSYGVEMEGMMREAIARSGGTVVGSSRLPVGTQDFSSAIASALGSGATHLGFAQAGHDAIRLVQQAHEFGIAGSGTKLVAEYMLLTDIHGLGRDAVQGLYNPTTFYWDADDRTRAFAKRFEARLGRPPTEMHAGVYSSVLHYLKAVRAAGTTDAGTVSAAMRAMPVDDAVVRGGTIRADGRLTRDMYLMRVKDEAEARGPWDLYAVVARIPAAALQSAAPHPDCKLP